MFENVVPMLMVSGLHTKIVSQKKTSKDEKQGKNENQNLHSAYNDDIKQLGQLA